MLHIHIDVVLVAKIGLASFARPACLAIFLPALVVTPVLRHLAFLDPLIPLARVALPRCLHDRRIHNLAAPGNITRSLDLR